MEAKSPIFIVFKALDPPRQRLISGGGEGHLVISIGGDQTRRLFHSTSDRFQAQSK
jgi:hypothetical protein